MNWDNTYLQFKSQSGLDSIDANKSRQSNFERFQAEGLPSRKLEAWKYTSLTDFKAIDWQSATTEEVALSHSEMQEVSKNLPSDFYNLVFVNGFLNRTLSDDLTSEITITEIDSDDFMKTENHIEANLINLAQSFLHKKIKIEVQPNKTFDKPVQVVIVQSSKSSVYLSEKIQVQLGKNSEMNLVVNTFSFANATADTINLNLEIKLAEHSRMKFVQLQNEDLNSFHFSQTEVTLASKANFQSLALTLGTRLTRNYLHINFLGKNANAGVFGLSVLNSNQHVDNYTFIQHSLGENESLQLYKSILAGSAQSVFRGRVRIEQDAQKANSEQLNNNLLLTREASANSIPQLEIYADDVKAGHGSTVGQLNKDEIFYFLSRGINQFEAVKMLSNGFAQEVIFKLENQPLQDFLGKALQMKLERMTQNA